MTAVDDRIRLWIAENVARGCTPASMIDALVAAGHARPYAEEVVAFVVIEIQTAPSASESGEGKGDVASQALALAEARAAGPRLVVPEPLPHGPE